MDQPSSAISPTHPPAGRIRGYDLARGVALFLMVLINAKAVFSAYDTEPLWVCRVMNSLDRRAAVVLVMLAGAGLTLLIRRSGFGTGSRILLKRAFFLVLAGSLLAREWEADILHFYGVFIGIGIVLSPLSNRNLLASAALFLVPGLVRHDVEIEEVLGMLDPASATGRLADLLLTGYYPVFPWAALFIAGMWLGRLDLQKPGLAVKLLLWGGLITGIAETVYLTVFHMAVSLALDSVNGEEGAAMFFYTLACFADTTLAAPTSFSMISGVGTGLLVIMPCMFLRDARQGGLLPLINAVGKTGLTLYVCHILCMNLIESVWRPGDDLGVLPVIAAAAVFFTVYAWGAHLWLSRYATGPLEGMMRDFPYLRYSTDKKAFTHVHGA